MSASSSERRWLALALAASFAACGVFELGPGSPDGSVARACENGVDDDGDGRVDFPDDPGCESADDPGELDPATARACSDGVDNDGDGRVDYDVRGDGVVGPEDDPGCASAADDDEINVTAPACTDGFDNDGDALTDYPADPGCSSRNDTSEVP